MVVDETRRIMDQKCTDISKSCNGAHMSIWPVRRRSAGRVDRSPIRHVYDRVDVGIRWCDSLGASSPTQLSPSPTIHTSYIALSLHVFRDVDVALSLPLSLYCVYERKCRPFQTVSFLGIPCSAELLLEFKVITLFFHTRLSLGSKFSSSPSFLGVSWELQLDNYAPGFYLFLPFVEY
nr:hypothetical protein Iba_chr12cCG0470 [Ipomoea batatas]